MSWRGRPRPTTCAEGPGNALRSAGRADTANTVTGSRWALVHNPEDLTGAQRTTLASIAVTNKEFYRAYLLTEQLRAVFHQRRKGPAVVQCRSYRGCAGHGVLAVSPTAVGMGLGEQRWSSRRSLARDVQRGDP
jgi:hypothetical protein